MQLQSNIAIREILSPLDWVIFSVVIFATIGLVIWGNRKKSQSAEEDSTGILDYLIMGRRLTLPLFVHAKGDSAQGDGRLGR